MKTDGKDAARTPLGKLHTIPEKNADVRKFIKNRLIFETLICSLWCAAVLVMSYLFGYFGRISAAFSGGRLRDCLILVVILVFASLPVMKLRSWRWLTDRTFEGEVVGARYDERYEPRNPALGGRSEKIWVLRQYIKLRLSDGKTKKLVLYQRFGQNLPIYHIGERVRHFYGTNKNHMQRLSSTDDEQKAKPICVLWGAQSELGDTECQECGASLPDNIERGLWG